MSSTQKSISHARVNMLLQLHAVHPIALSAAHLRTGLLEEGLVLDLSLVKSQLESLIEAGFVTKQPDRLNAAIIRYQRTEAGRVYLADNNHIE